MRPKSNTHLESLVKSAFLKELIQRLEALFQTLEAEEPPPSQIKGQIASVIESIEARLKDEELADQIDSAISEENDDLILENAQLVKENAALHAKLSHQEQSLLVEGIRLRKTEETQNRWTPFCPNCNSLATFPNVDYQIFCSANCGWTSDVNKDELAKIIAKLDHPQ